MLTRFLAALWLMSWCGCSSSSAGSRDGDGAACTVELSGNVADLATLREGCGDLSKAADSGHWLLSFNVASPKVAGLQAIFDLGVSPVAGSYSSETTTWSEVALGNGNSECSYSAGNAAVPTGSFILTLTSIDTTAETAHGELTIESIVHAPPATDCGPGDGQTIRFSF